MLNDNIIFMRERHVCCFLFCVAKRKRQTIIQHLVLKLNNANVLLMIKMKFTKKYVLLCNRSWLTTSLGILITWNWRVNKFYIDVKRLLRNDGENINKQSFVHSCFYYVLHHALAFPKFLSNLAENSAKHAQWYVA